MTKRASLMTLIPKMSDEQLITFDRMADLAALGINNLNNPDPERAARDLRVPVFHSLATLIPTMSDEQFGEFNQTVVWAGIACLQYRDREGYYMIERLALAMHKRIISNVLTPSPDKSVLGASAQEGSSTWLQ